MLTRLGKDNEAFHLHSDDSYLLYLVAVLINRSKRQGVYFPNPIPSYLFKQTQTADSTIRPAEVMKDEIFRAVLRKRLGNL